MTVQERERLYFDFEQARANHKYATALRIIDQMPESLASGARKKMETSKALSRAMAEDDLRRATEYEDFDDFDTEKYDELTKLVPLEPGLLANLIGMNCFGRDGDLSDIYADFDDSIIVGLYGPDWRTLPASTFKASSDRLHAMKVSV